MKLPDSADACATPVRSDDRSPPPGEPPHAPTRRRWWWWVAAVIATACVWFFLRTFDLRAVGTRLAHSNPGWVVVAIVANFVTLPLMTEQWKRLLPAGSRARWRVLWECVTLSMASMNTLPFGGGHAVAVGLMATRGVTNVPGAISLLALEQLCEGVARVLLLLAAFATAPLPPLLQQAAWALVACLVAGFAGLWWLANHPAKNPTATGWRARWGRHLEVLRRPRAFLVATGLSVAMKVFGLVAVYAVHRSLGVALPFSSTPLVLAAVLFATSMAVSPGNVGLYELAAVAAYRLLGVPPADAAALALLLHATFLIPMIGMGYGLTLWHAVMPARVRHG